MLSEDRKIKTRAQLKETLAIECARYPLSARRIVPYLLQISEGAILRRHTVLLRKTEYYRNTGRRVLAALFEARLMRLQNRHALHIPLNTCGKGLQIFHLFPVCMNGNVTVGEYCRILPNVSVIGDDTAADLAPTVGDHVTLGIGCTLLGGITIADGVTVGAGAVVTKSFLEPGITVAGVPAKKISDHSRAARSVNASDGGDAPGSESL